MKRTNNYSILILTHYYSYGPADDLEWYLNKIMNVQRSTIVKIPLKSEENKVIITSYEKGEKIFERSFHFPSINTRIPSLEIAAKIIEYTLSIISITAEAKHYDIAIAQDPITATIAIMLKQKNYISKVILQSHNFTSPTRSKLYKFLDLYTTTHSDIVWCLSNRLAEIRRKLGAKYTVQTPICIRDDVIDKTLNYTRRKSNDIVYIGSLSKDKGVDILLELVKTFTKNGNDTIIHIVGKGLLYEKIFERIGEINKRVIYYGPQPLKRALQIASRASLGVVLTRPSYESLTTDPMKPKVYLAAHTPVILPEYFEISSYVNRFKAGMVVGKLKPSYILSKVKVALEDSNTLLKGAERLAKS